MKIAFTGVPPRKILKKYFDSYPSAEWIDLDVPLREIDRKRSVIHIPETTCSIIQTILANAEFIKPDVVIASIGACKCDPMRFLVPIIKRLCPESKVLECTNTDKEDYGYPVSQSDLPLVEKFEIITSNVTNLEQKTQYPKSNPRAGFWGVPPYDYSLLKLFPPKTHIFGWTRCMENKTPDNPELEYHIEEGLPTVFFCQSFCPKNIIAKELAYTNKGLYLEMDGKMDKSTMAKVSAFLELKNCY